MRKFSRALAALALLLSPCATTARAQAGPNMYNLPIRQTMQTMDLSHRLFLMRRSSARRGRGGSSSRRTPSAPSRPSKSPGPVAGSVGADTTFSSTGSAVAPAYLARTIGRNPDERTRLERMFSDLLENFRDNARRSGGEINDVARSATYLIAASYSVYFDAEPLGPEAYAALREQVRQAFADDAQFQRMPDRDKQRVFESYAITGAWIDIGHQIVKRQGDRQAAEQWREMARVNLQNMLGAPPERVRFTPSGVEYR